MSKFQRELGERLLRESIELDSSYRSVPQPTAYDRAQAKLVRRIETVCANNEALLTAFNMMRDRLTSRIEALEAEVARLKAWSRPPENMCLQCGAGFVTADHKQTHKCQSSDDETVDVSVPAYEHFKACGPTCEHVFWCQQCADQRALCQEHVNNPSAGCSWKE